MLFPDSKSPAAGKMLTPPEARSGRSKCPSALEAWRKNPCKHNPKSSAAVSEEIGAPTQILQQILCVDPACPVSPVSCLCPEHAASHSPRCLQGSYVPSPVPADSAAKEGILGILVGHFPVLRGVSVLLRAAPSCGHRAPGWRRGLRHRCRERPWPGAGSPVCCPSMGRTMSTCVSRLEDPPRFSPVPTWLYTSHMLPPPLLTSARHRQLLSLDVVGGRIDEQRLASVFAFLTVQLWPESGGNPGQQAGDEQAERGAGRRCWGRISPGRCSAGLGRELCCRWEGDSSLFMCGAE